MDAIGFGLADYLPEIEQGRPFSACYTVELNEYRGQRSVQLRESISASESRPFPAWRKRGECRSARGWPGNFFLRATAVRGRASLLHRPFRRRARYTGCINSMHPCPSA